MNVDIQNRVLAASVSLVPTDITPAGIPVSELGIPDGHVLVLGLLPLRDGVLESVRTGSVDLVMQGIPFDEFLRTIRVLIAKSEEHPPIPGAPARDRYFPQAEALAESEPSRASTLTSRERQVMSLIGAGSSNKEIATRLNVRVHTVKTHVHNVLTKLAVRTRLEAAALFHAADTARAQQQFSRVA